MTERKKIKEPQILEKILGATELNVDDFNISKTVPCIRIPYKHCQKVMKIIRKRAKSKQRFKMNQISKTHMIYPLLEDEETVVKPLISELTWAEESFDEKEEADGQHHKNKKLPKEILQSLIFDKITISLSFDHFNASEIISSILPDNIEAISGFATIGHICHVNLRPEHNEYEKIIGQVLIRKLSPKIRTILTKTSKIESEFRTLPLKVIAGEEDFITDHHEHNCFYQMDFSKVYWNSRLSDEHQRVVDYILKKYKNDGDDKFSVIDACAGIGPFVIPLAKRGFAQNKNLQHIFANDLNPDSMKYLVHNIYKNRIIANPESNLPGIHVFVNQPMDGAEFCQKVLSESTKFNFTDQKLIILMNLPRFSVSQIMPNLRRLLLLKNVKNNEKNRNEQINKNVNENFNESSIVQLPKSIEIIAHHMCGNDDFSDDTIQSRLPKNFKLNETWEIRQLVGEKYLRLSVMVELDELMAEAEKVMDAEQEPPAKILKVNPEN